VQPTPAVVLGDTMGELVMFYAAADVAFVAGSLVPVGGHNLLEPAAAGVPVVTGPHNFNGQDIYDRMVEAGAVTTVADGPALSAAVSALLADAPRRHDLGERGRRVALENRGALARLLALIVPLLGDARHRPGDPAGGTQ
jgi:3-deoxy-D-manno-octulosonic-acid transferase